MVFAHRRLSALALLAVIVFTGAIEIAACVGGWYASHASLDARIRRHYAREARAHACHSGVNAMHGGCCGEKCSGVACRCGQAAPEGLVFQLPGCHDGAGARMAPTPSSLEFRFLVGDDAMIAQAPDERDVAHAVAAADRVLERGDAPPSPPPERAAA